MFAKQSETRTAFIKGLETQSDEFQKQFMALQTTFVEQMSKLQVERDQFKDSYHQRREKEDELLKLVTTEEEEPSFAAIDEFFANNDTAGMDDRLVKIAKKVSIQLYIGAMIAKMQEALEEFDAVELKTQYDEVCGKNIILDSALVDQIEDMLYDAEGNENY